MNPMPVNLNDNVAPNANDAFTFDLDFNSFDVNKFTTNNSDKIKDMYSSKMMLYKQFLEGKDEADKNENRFERLRENLNNAFDMIYSVNVDKDLEKIKEYEKKRTPFADHFKYNEDFFKKKDIIQNENGFARENIDINDNSVIAAQLVEKRAKELNEINNPSITKRLATLMKGKKKKNDYDVDSFIIDKETGITFGEFKKILKNVYEDLKNNCTKIKSVNKKLNNFAKQLDKFNVWIKNTEDNIGECDDVCNLIEKKITKWFRESNIPKCVEKHNLLLREKKINSQIMASLKMFSSFNSVCAICRTDDKSHAFVPCGHTFCQSCTESMNKCPMCNKNPDSTIKIYL